MADTWIRSIQEMAGKMQYLRREACFTKEELKEKESRNSGVAQTLLTGSLLSRDQEAQDHSCFLWPSAAEGFLVNTKDSRNGAMFSLYDDGFTTTSCSSVFGTLLYSVFTLESYKIPGTETMKVNLLCFPDGEQKVIVEV